MIDFRALRPPPDIMGGALNAFTQGRQFVGQQQAGNALAMGDPMAAQNALFRAGLTDQGLALQDRERTMGRQAVADQRQAAAFERQQKDWTYEDVERARTTVLREAYALRQTPPDQRVNAYRQRAVPLLREMGIPPEQLEGDFLNDEALSDQEIDAFITRLGGARTDDVRPTVAAPGSWVLDAQGNPLQKVPFAPQLRPVGPGQELHLINPNNPGGGGGGGPMASLDFDAVDALVRQEFGVGVNSATRTPERNAAVDGVPNSYHLSGQARDYPIPPGMTAQQFAAQLQARVGPDYEVIPEPRRNHVHIEPAPQRGGSQVVARGAPKEQAQMLTPQEASALGLPAGTVAQRLPDGRIDVVSDQRAGGRPVPQTAAAGLLANRQQLAKVDRAIAAIEADPGALGLKNYAPDWLVQRMDKGGVPERAILADIGSAKIHDRSGAAVAAAEFPRLRPFVPQATDHPDTAVEKLKNFKIELEALIEETEGFYGPQAGYLPIQGAGSSPPSSAGWKIERIE